MTTLSNPVFDAADLHNVAATDNSFLDSAGDFFTKGVPLAIASGLNSMYNTGVALGNTLGGDFEKAPFEEKVRSYDDDLTQYYQDHKQGVDLGGFVATSFIPGTVGLKALKVMQAGNLGKNMARSTNLFNDIEASQIAKATSAIQRETNQVFKTLDANKIGAIAAGFGEQALQTAAFETTVLLTMNQSPVINKEDQSYLQAMVYNALPSLENAVLGGFIGGGIHAFSISGELKALVRARDFDDFPSLNITRLGLSDLDVGTAAGADFNWLRQRQARFEAEAAAGKLNERQLKNYRESQLQKENELRLRLTNDLAKTETGKADSELSKQLWEHLNGLPKATSESGQLTNSAADIATTLLGAARKVSRITEEDLPETVEKVLTDSGALPTRLAKNFIRKDATAPGVFDSMDDVTAAELGGAGFVTYRDSAGNLRVVPGTDYSKRALARKASFRKHDLIVKLSGDEAGRVTESAFPTVGDLGKVELSKKGELIVDGKAMEVPSFDPLVNSPLQSSAAFAKEKLTPKFHVDAEDSFRFTKNDLPKIEKAYNEGFEAIEVEGYAKGTPVAQILKELKEAKRQELINLSHPFDQIARELNVSKSFAESGEGDFVLKDNLLVPQYGKFNYNTKSVPDKSTLRGVVDLMQRVKIAREHTQKASAFILGEDYELLPQTEGTLRGVNTLPEGGSYIGSANENYGNTGQAFQQVGKVNATAVRRRYGEVQAQIGPYENAVRSDPAAIQELNMLTAKIRSYPEPIAMSYINEGDLSGYYIFPKKLLKDAQDGELGLADLIAKVQETKPEAIVKIENEASLAYLQKFQGIVQERIPQWNAYYAAVGQTLRYDKEAFFLPPINIDKYPFVAFVRETAVRDVRPISVITAKDSASFEAKVRKIRQEFGDRLEVLTPTDVKIKNQLRGDYEQEILPGNSTVDNSLAKAGILSDFAPRNDTAILDDFNSWHWEQESALVRNGIRLQYAQEFAELGAMGEQFTAFQKTLRGKSDVEANQSNPYYRYIQLALGIGNYNKYDSIWGRLNQSVEALGKSMFGIWDGMFQKASKGEVDWGEANRIAESYGFRPPYQDPLREIFNPIVQDRKVVEPLVQKANFAVATLILRLDPLNAIVNILGTPALMASELSVIRRNLTDPAIVGKLSEMLSVTVPGSAHQMPSTMKLMTTALKNFITDDGSRLEYYNKIGAVPDDLQLYKSAIDSTALTVKDLNDLTSIKAWTNNLASKAADVGASLTGNKLSERMVRFVAADVMKQLTDVARVPESEVAAYINTFVNRVHGNFVASQRPAIFQGAVGSAISLFQTYQFNVMQQMIRYLETNEKHAATVMLGLQNTFFGIQGNPAYYLLNSYIGNSNREHTDIHTGIYATVGKETGDWLTYGLGANALHMNLYNRGDLTPRYVTVVPTNLTDTPVVSITAKAVANVFDMAKNIAKGGDIPTSILNGIAHNGFNRPLAGIAQLAMGGRTTTSGGNLLAAYNDIDTGLVAAKVLGGERLNDAIAIDALNRNMGYKTKTAHDIASVGEALKTKLYKNQQLTSEDTTGFMAEYARAGGNVRNFNRWMLDSWKDANRSQVNKMMETLGTPYAKNLGTIMGGQPLEDNYSHPAAATPNPQE